MAWSVSVLPKADQDLEALTGGDRAKRNEIEAGILDEFKGMKGDASRSCSARVCARGAA